VRPLLNVNLCKDEGSGNKDSSEAASSLLVLDLSQLRNVTLNDEMLMREVVRALVSDTSHKIEELHQAVEREDVTVCARVAHSAQGACGNVGAASLAALFYTIEQHALKGDLNTCRSLLDNLKSELEKLRSEAGSI
jgi:HPt (histidine-containing phosphotransfer) domain-containing protein